ncbi:hypothetical protein BJ322DRAFT_1222322 [Thelephora terrestris]|uniref:Uncharacterized protein n=1 Tax=Thelephora terrestris TaxID=56493 RepID=A0A9P6H2T9_9AGAM|nr:hypothetical protein BJ322DRAFT_1222322 [Thelephora terrestris]
MARILVVLSTAVATSFGPHGDSHPNAHHLEASGDGDSLLTCSEEAEVILGGLEPLQHVRGEKLGTVRSSQQGQDYAGDTTAPRQSQRVWRCVQDLFEDHPPGAEPFCLVMELHAALSSRTKTLIFSDMQFPVPQQHTHLFLVTDLRTARLRLPRRDPLNAHDQTTGRALLESWHSIIASPIPSAEGLTHGTAHFTKSKKTLALCVKRSDLPPLPPTQRRFLHARGGGGIRQGEKRWLRNKPLAQRNAGDHITKWQSAPRCIVWTGFWRSTTRALQIRSARVISWAPWSKRTMRCGVVVQITARMGAAQGDATQKPFSKSQFQHPESNAILIGGKVKSEPISRPSTTSKVVLKYSRWKGEDRSRAPSNVRALKWASVLEKSRRRRQGDVHPSIMELEVLQFVEMVVGKEIRDVGESRVEEFWMGVEMDAPYGPPLGSILERVLHAGVERAPFLWSSIVEWGRWVSEVSFCPIFQVVAQKPQSSGVPEATSNK